MKNFIKKNIGALAVIAAVIYSSTIIIAPRQAHAQVTISEDFLNYAENVLKYLKDEVIAASGEVTAVEQTDETLQDTVLDKIAIAIAKQLLMQITDDVVKWIDSGFNGNPAFIQNPAAFFQNIGDQATAQFIASNGQLSSLCSPFSLQVRMAIAQTQTQNDGVTNANGQNQFSCTLSTIIQNGTNAVNSTVQGFTNGDFSQGGWAAFAALTTQPQNTPNGAYLTAEDALQQKIANQVTQKQTQLNQGGGFLSWETCTPNTSDSSASDSSDPYGNAYNNIVAGDNSTDNSTSDNSTPGSADTYSGLTDEQLQNELETNDCPDNAASGICYQLESIQAKQNTQESTATTGGTSDPYNMGAENDPTQNCSIQTPGSVISAALNTHLAVPTDSLLLANSVNDIISALFTTLITTTLQDGLASLTNPGSGPSGGAYLQDLENEQSSSSPAFQSSQQTALQAMSAYITIDTQVAQNYDMAMTIASNATTTLDQANSCYQTAQTSITSASSTLDASTTAAALAYIQYQVGRVDEQEATITPIVMNLSNQDGQADDALSAYTNIQSEIQNAQNVNELQQPEQELQSIIQSGNIPIQTNVTQSQQDLQTYTTDIIPVQKEANTLLSECQSFVPSDSTTYNTQ